MYVDLYADSSINFTSLAGPASLSQSTLWPYGSDVSFALTLPSTASDVPLDIAIRVPQWIDTKVSALVVKVNGALWPVEGAPGSYLHINQTWPGGQSSLSFTLPMTVTTTRYGGASQLPPYSRWGIFVGPIQMAVTGAWNTTLSASTMPWGIDPAAPYEWMRVSVCFPMAPTHLCSSLPRFAIWVTQLAHVCDPGPP